MIEIFARGEQDYFLIIKDDKIMAFYLEDEYDSYKKNEKCLYDKCSYIRFTPKVFIELMKLLNVDISDKVSPNTGNDIFDREYIQNEKHQKLIIDEVNHEYMIKTFISKTNEEDFHIIYNDLYDKVIQALKICDYKLIDYNENYLVTKKEVLNNMNEIIEYHKYDIHYMFERNDYFNIDKIKDVFQKFYNEEIEESYFSSFCYLMMMLTSFYPSNISQYKKNIYHIVSDLFDGLAFGVSKEEKTNISESYVYFKYLYKKLNNVKIKNKVLLYYDFDHCNWKTGTDIYQVAIFDKKSKLYWMGFVEEPIFDFEEDYIPYTIDEDINSESFKFKNYFNFEDEEIDNIEFEEKHAKYLFDVFNNDNYFEKYSFSTEIVNLYFKKHIK